MSDNKPRGLIVITADAGFAEGHPLWGTYQALRERLEEIHVVILTRQHVHKRDRMVKPDEQTFWYVFRVNGLFFRLRHIWAVLKFHLRWRTVYRPDFVMSLEPGTMTLLAWFLSWRMRRPFFTRASVQATELSSGYLVRRWILRHALRIFVPGINTAQKISHTFRIPESHVVPVVPSVDLPALKLMKDRHDFEKEHQVFNVFLSSVVHTTATLHRLVTIHTKVRLQFPRCGLVVIADEALYKKARRIARRHMGVFVYPMRDTYLSYIKGTSMYIALSIEQDFDVMMIAALGIGMPVVAGAYGIAKELFPGSPYEQFLCEPGDVHDIVAKVVVLLKDQYLRNQYGLNNPALSGKIAFATASQYVTAMMDTIEPLINPPDVHSAALPGTRYVYTDITPRQ